MELIMTDTLWTDTAANGVRKHNIWKQNNKWSSITFNTNINEEERFIMEVAFNNLYYKSAWFNRMCETPKIGVYVRNGFHFSDTERI